MFLTRLHARCVVKDMNAMQTATGKRKVSDCRDMPSVNNCTLVISGSEEEVVKVATRHAIEEHGHEDTPALREEIRAGLKDEE